MLLRGFSGGEVEWGGEQANPMRDLQKIRNSTEH